MEVHQVVDFIFSKNQQILAVTGPKQIGIETIVTKSIAFGVERHPNIKFDSTFKVELGGISQFSEVIFRISKVLNLNCTQHTEACLVQEISKIETFTLVYFARCRYFDEKDDQRKLLKLLERITYN